MPARLVRSLPHWPSWGSVRLEWNQVCGSGDEPATMHDPVPVVAGEAGRRWTHPGCSDERAPPFSSLRTGNNIPPNRHTELSRNIRHRPPCIRGEMVGMKPAKRKGLPIVAKSWLPRRRGGRGQVPDTSGWSAYGVATAGELQLLHSDLPGKACRPGPS